MDDPSQANAVRQRFATGQIPKLDFPLNEFGGPSRGQSCAGCARDIPPGNLEIEVLDANGRRYYFHPMCHVAYLTLRLGENRVA